MVDEAELTQDAVQSQQSQQPQLSLHVRLADREDLSSRGVVQGALFELESDEEEVGYRGVIASKVAGITYRQLDYWARKHIVEPSVTPSSGSGSRRLYSFKDIVILSVAKKLLDAGVNLNNVTTALAYLEQRRIGQLENVTIMCDGVRIYECTNETEMLDLMRDGHAVFGVSVGVMWHEISAALKAETSVSKADNTRAHATEAMHRAEMVDETNGLDLGSEFSVRDVADLTEQRMREKLEKQKRARVQGAAL
ncbi:MerR family transcriptional regulator [Alloscardovia macacae]|uniref:Transcriptional regulator n=1 Tax=Alloscardovia macacae TaxID=1160091 RepID=A0A261F5S3_9BIFI|nr:MerR family transcriptional regulator [Alloscardovia macacae]OZG54444.1 transcriptional regulator [Alloscardovia macacae]